MQTKLNGLSRVIGKSKPPSSEKRTRTRLDLVTKISIAEELKGGASQTSVMNKYKISRRQCSKIRTEETQLRKTLQSASGLEHRKSLRSGKYPVVEEELVKFISFARKAGVSITRDVIHFRALKIKAELLSKEMDDVERKALEHFSPSESWVTKFVKRHGLKSIRLHGEAGSVDPELVREGIKKLRRELESYSLDRIYNMDETGLFYRLLPRQLYVFREDKKTVRVVKGIKAKDRITLIVPSNADASHFIPLTVIGSAKAPRAFILRRCPLPYL